MRCPTKPAGQKCLAEAGESQELLLSSEPAGELSWRRLATTHLGSGTELPLAGWPGQASGPEAYSQVKAPPYTTTCFFVLGGAWCGITQLFQCG